MLAAALALTLFAQVVGNPIVQAPTQSQSQSQGGGNVNVTITPPQPDPAATQAMYSYVIANTEYDHAAIPVNAANGILNGANIWTQTPVAHFGNDAIRGMRANVRNVMLGLFLLGILWTAIQLVVGSGSGFTAYQQVLPLLIGGFLVGVYAETITTRAVELNNWICAQLASPSLTDFTGSSLTLPERPEFNNNVAIPLQFFAGLLGSLIYAIVLIILEVKMIFREAVLWVTWTAMPIAGALYAFDITRRWGTTLAMLFFGWLYGQPLVVLCLALGGSLLTLLNVHDGAGEVLVKIGILLVALKCVSIFAPGGMGAGPAFGLASLLLLSRRISGIGRGASSGATPPPAPQPAAATQPGAARGSGDGTAASGRPWRPALGAA